MDWKALKTALLRFGAQMTLFGVMVAVIVVLVSAIKLLPGISELIAKIALFAIVLIWTIRQLYLNALDDEKAEGDDAE